MATIDMANNILIKQCTDPDVYTSAPASLVVDTAGYESVTIELSLGAYTDGNWGFYIQTSNVSNDAGFNPVFEATAIVTGEQLFPYSSTTPMYFPYSTSDTNYTVTTDAWEANTYWIGYSGPNRWIQPVVIASDVTDGMYFGINVILGFPHTSPTRLVSPNQVG